MSVTHRLLSAEKDKSQIISKRPSGMYNAFIEAKLPKRKIADVAAPTLYQRICKQQQKHCLIGGKGPDPQQTRQVTKEKSPYWLPSAWRQESYNLYLKANKQRTAKNENQLSTVKRNNDRSRQVCDLRERLYLPEPPDKVKTILDFYDEYFSIVEGRPVVFPFNYKDYKLLLEETLLIRLGVGYQENEILKITEAQLNESARYTEVCERYNRCVDNFERFLSDDYNLSMHLVKRSEEVSMCVQKKNKDYNKLNARLGILQNKIYVLEEKCRLLKMYQDFLYKLSPIAWCNDNNIVKIKDLDCKITTDMTFKESKLFEQYKVPLNADGEVTLEAMIAYFNTNCMKFRRPILYFEKPADLLEGLYSMEKDLGYNWNNSAELIRHVRLLKKNREFNTFLDQERADLIKLYNKIYVAVKEEERKTALFKKRIIRVIKTSFFDTIASTDSVLLEAGLKYLHQKLIFRHVTLSVRDMLASLSAEYKEQMSILDNIDPAIVERATRGMEINEAYILRKAHIAAGKIAQIDKLRKTFEKLLQPAFVKKPGKPVMTRMLPPQKQKCTREMEYIRYDSINTKRHI